jgi:Rrf2 family protein
MAHLQKISEAGSLALHSAIALAQVKDGSLLSAGRIAGLLQASEAHLLKVLQRMVRSGFVESSRGPGGGYRLTRPAEDISVLEIYEEFEGKITSDECLLKKKVCSGSDCALRDFLGGISEQARKQLAKTRLSDLL